MDKDKAFDTVFETMDAAMDRLDALLNGKQAQPAPKKAPTNTDLLVVPRWALDLLADAAGAVLGKSVVDRIVENNVRDN
jgi:hypothetical protein